jgi:hypothetical protein
VTSTEQLTEKTEVTNIDLNKDATAKYINFPLTRGTHSCVLIIKNRGCMKANTYGPSISFFCDVAAYTSSSAQLSGGDGYTLYLYESNRWMQS